MPESAETVEDEGSAPRDPFFLRRRRDRFRKKLDELLARADDESFLRMIWAADAIEQKRSNGWAWFTTHPPDLMKRISEGRFFHKWTLETLANEVLGTKKIRQRSNRANRSLDCRHLWAAANAVNLLNELENAEDGMALRRVSVFSEMHRLAQRQFPWQRGKVNKTSFYKSWYLYGFAEAQSYFLDRYRISMSDLSLICFGLYGLVQEYPGVVLPIDFRRMDISAETAEIALNLVGQRLNDARDRARIVRRSSHHTSYRRSVLREKPVVRFPRYIVVPLPALLIERITSGLYYDLVTAGGQIRNKISRRFEMYCIDLFRGYLTDFTVVPEFKYRTKDSPDIILLFEGKISAVVECKAKKEPVSAKFGEEQRVLSSPGLDEIAKGVFQLWRFFAHVRQGLVDKTPTADIAAVGVLLMLDTWLEASEGQRAEVMRRARTLADQSSVHILEEDQRPIVFCHVDDLERLLMVTTDADFLRTLEMASSVEFQGWHLEGLHSELEGVQVLDKPDPFAERMETTVEWFGRVSQNSDRAPRS